MKRQLVLPLLSLLSTTAFASPQFFCGTTNQWPDSTGSGWFMQFYPDSQQVFVSKAYNATTTRTFSYKISENTAKTFTLTSPFNDELIMRRSENGDFSYNVSYKNLKASDRTTPVNSDPEENFTVTCHNNSIIKTISLTDLSIPNDLETYTLVHNLDSQDRNYFYELTDREPLPFPLLAQLLQHNTLSEIGDWEDTILNKSQLEKVLTTLIVEDKPFAELINKIESDGRRHVGLSLKGILFARDWYGGEGRVGLVLQYKNQLMVIPYTFDSSKKFDDARLDYTN